MSEDYTKLRRMLKKTRTKNDPKLGHKKPSKKNIHAYNGRIKILLLLRKLLQQIRGCFGKGNVDLLACGQVLHRCRSCLDFIRAKYYGKRHFLLTGVL